MNGITPQNKPPIKNNNYASAVNVIVSIALAALSTVGIMKGMDRYTRWSITSMQRKIGGCVMTGLLTIIYYIGFRYLFGSHQPKKDEKKPPQDGNDANKDEKLMEPKEDFYRSNSTTSSSNADKSSRNNNSATASQQKFTLKKSNSLNESDFEIVSSQHTLPKFNEFGLNVIFHKEEKKRRINSKYCEKENATNSFLKNSSVERKRRNSFEIVEQSANPIQGVPLNIIAYLKEKDGVCQEQHNDCFAQENDLEKSQGANLNQELLLQSDHFAIHSREEKKILHGLEVKVSYDKDLITSVKIQERTICFKDAITWWHLEQDQDIKTIIENKEYGATSALKPQASKPFVLEKNVQLRSYDKDFHGVNGDRMQEVLFSSLLTEYTTLLQQGFDCDPAEKLMGIIQSKEAHLCIQQQYLERVLVYLVFYAKDRLENEIRSLVEEKNNGLSHQQRYNKFIEAHQQLMASCQPSEKNEYNSQFLKDQRDDAIVWGRLIAHVRMIPRMQSYQNSLVVAHYEQLPTVSATTFDEVFTARNQGIKQADASMKLSATVRALRKTLGATTTCDYFAVNPPNVRSVERWCNDEGWVRDIFYLRHATPHIADGSINLVYKEFLRSAQASNEGVIYAIHQRLGDYQFFEKEGQRVDAIIELELAHPNLITLVQSVENDLFTEGASTIDDLKKRIIASFSGKAQKCGNRLPPFLMQRENDVDTIHPSYQKMLGKICDLVCDTFFKDVSEMTLETSQEFILLFYHFQREHLKVANLAKYGYNFTVRYINSGCKDNYDRGGGQNCVSDRVHQHQMFGQEVDEHYLEATLSSIQAPPIQGKGKEVIPDRIAPALRVSERLANLNEEQLNDLKNLPLGDNWTFIDYRIPYVHGQEITKPR